jgi:L-fucose isomerase-like protein
MKKKTTFGVIVGNRGVFPDALALAGRKNILDVLKKNGYGTVVVAARDTNQGAIETLEEAKKCAALFASKRENIDGIIVSLPNFGDEKGVAETIKRAGLNVPVLIHAEPDDPSNMLMSNRGDSFCGKISVADNLSQAGIPFSLTKSHTVKAQSAEFKAELEDFAAVCRVVGGLKGARFGAIGTRTNPFNSVRYSEKILEAANISIDTIDLSEIFGQMEKLGDKDKVVTSQIAKFKKALPITEMPREAQCRLAKFAVVVSDWIAENELDGTAIQCWTSVQQYMGICTCPAMSLMNEALVPSACEVDVCGLLSMYVLQLAGQVPSALLDWNNNFGDDPNKCVLFHCSAVPPSMIKKVEMCHHGILDQLVGEENSWGCVTGRIKAGPATYFRTNTDDTAGVISAYVGEGKFTAEKIKTFGCYGVIDIPNLQPLMQYICKLGFAHHIAVNHSKTAEPITEALENYLGWEVYHHA